MAFLRTPARTLITPNVDTLIFNPGHELGNNNNKLNLISDEHKHNQCTQQKYLQKVSHKICAL